MEWLNKVLITDREGWQRELVVRKQLVYIGSDPKNDVVLDARRGTGVDARHAQLFVTAAGYRLVNVGGADIGLGANSERVVHALSSATVAEGEPVKMGDFTVVFQSLFARADGASISPAARANGSAGRALPAVETGICPIALRLVLSSAQLGPDAPVDGVITVSNQGAKAGVQFHLEVAGIDDRCIEIGPSPILFPNAEKDVWLRLTHTRQPAPAAADYRLTVRATAPDAYPGEAASAAQVVRIMPIYQHHVRLLLDGL